LRAWRSDLTNIPAACSFGHTRVPETWVLRTRGPQGGKPYLSRPRSGLSDRPARKTLGVPQPIREGGREALKVARGATPTHQHLRSRLAFLLVATVLLDAVASVLILLFERHAAGTDITTLGDSVFWTSTQLLTVSSQLPNPISTPARVLDVLLQAYAISAVAILAGSFGAFFHRRGMERDPPNDPAAL
jgi:hypothetical protein